MKDTLILLYDLQMNLKKRQSDLLIKPQVANTPVLSHTIITVSKHYIASEISIYKKQLSKIKYSPPYHSVKNPFHKKGEISSTVKEH